MQLGFIRQEQMNLWRGLLRIRIQTSIQESSTLPVRGNMMQQDGGGNIVMVVMLLINGNV